jgi:hypothetical protein
VRRECLEEALGPVSFQHGTRERIASGRIERRWRGLPGVVQSASRTTYDVAGISGGTTEAERCAAREVAPAEAVELLECTVTDRVERRIAAYLRVRIERRREGRLPGQRRHVDRIDAILEEMGRKPRRGM